MGRTFPSIRDGINDIASRWARSSRWLKRDDQKYGELLVKYTKVNASEAFDACQEPLEGAIFSALVEIIKRQERLEEMLN